MGNTVQTLQIHVQLRAALTIQCSWKYSSNSLNTRPVLSEQQQYVNNKYLPHTFLPHNGNTMEVGKLALMGIIWYSPTQHS